MKQQSKSWGSFWRIFLTKRHFEERLQVEVRAIGIT